MRKVDIDQGWHEVPGTQGVSIKPLSGTFDEDSRRGFRTRYVRFEPGGRTFSPFTHSYWEEAALIEGSVTLVADGETLEAPAYVIRPPGTPHGPLISETGCLMLETQYFAERDVGETEYLDKRSPLSR